MGLSPIPERFSGETIEDGAPNLLSDTMRIDSVPRNVDGIPESDLHQLGSSSIRWLNKLIYGLKLYSDNALEIVRASLGSDYILNIPNALPASAKYFFSDHLGNINFSDREPDFGADITVIGDTDGVPDLVTTLSVTAKGGPILLVFAPSSSFVAAQNIYSFRNDGGTVVDMRLDFYRDATLIQSERIYFDNWQANAQAFLGLTNMFVIDPYASPGNHTYSVYIRGDGIGTQGAIRFCRLSAFQP